MGDCSDCQAREPGNFEKAPPPKNQLPIRIASSNRDEIFFGASEYTQLSKDIESAELHRRGGDASRFYLPYIFHDVYCTNTCLTALDRGSGVDAIPMLPFNSSIQIN